MNNKKLKNFRIFLLALPACALMCFGLVLFTQNSVFVSNDRQDNNFAENTSLVDTKPHAITAETNLNNNVELNTTEAVAGETVTATVTDQKYGYSVADVSFVDEEGKAIENLNQELVDNVIKFTMPATSVKLSVSYSTTATSDYNTPKNYEGQMT